MKTIITSFLIECQKLRRTKIVSITFGLFIFIPVMMSFLVYVSKHPEAAGNSGLISMKASMFGENDWSGYMKVILEVGAGIGLLGSGFVFSYIFGREYIDKTFKDLLALPISRISIVFGKLLVAFVWCSLLFIILYITAIIGGNIAGVSGDSSVIFSMAGSYSVLVVLTMLITLPVAFIACYGKGITAPLGYVLLTIVLANLVANIGLGPVFPWAIPGLTGMNSAEPGLQVHITGYIIFSVTVALGLFLTIYYWLNADHQ